MARHAKDADKQVSDADIKRHVSAIMEHYENIESARGKFMNSARKERDAMTSIYEGLASQGVSQRSAKTSIKITRALERIKGWIADLEEDDRKMAQRFAKAQGDRRQLSLFGDEPQQRAPRRKKSENVVDLHTTNGDAMAQA